MQFERGWKWAATAAAVVLLAACGGGGSSAPAGSASCDVASQKDWLRGYMLDWYYWSGSSPNPDPAGYATLDAYFDALKYTSYPGPRGPIDPWSGYVDSVTYNRFFAEGRAMDYGIFVNGLEGALPLRIRMVEPKSPAGLGGLQRGDVIKAINGVADSALLASGFAVLSPAQAGTQVNVDIERAGVPQRVTLSAAEYDLTPVPASATLTRSSGAKVGYVALKDFIIQAETSLTTRLDAIKADGATELIVDLRYNGGGRISTANHLASQIVGALHGGKVFTSLVYNAAHQNSNSSFTMAAVPGSAFSRVVVITGPRTCSASELIVNGLSPYAQVTTVGGTSCGKPYGFSPVESCGNVFSVVNFRANNARDEANYDAGIAPTCAVADTFTGTLGDPAEALTGAALDYLQTRICPVAAAPARAGTLQLRRFAEPGDRPGMTAD